MLSHLIFLTSTKKFRNDHVEHTRKKVHPLLADFHQKKGPPYVEENTHIFENLVLSFQNKINFFDDDVQGFTFRIGFPSWPHLEKLNKKKRKNLRFIFDSRYSVANFIFTCYTKALFHRLKIKVWEKLFFKKRYRQSRTLLKSNSFLHFPIICQKVFLSALKYDSIRNY